jgi:hypothetical protein
MVVLYVFVERVWPGKQCVFVNGRYSVQLIIKYDISRLCKVLSVRVCFSCWISTDA